MGECRIGCLAGPGECFGHILTLFMHAFTPKIPKIINEWLLCARIPVHSLRLAAQEDKSVTRQQESNFKHAKSEASSPFRIPSITQYEVLSLLQPECFFKPMHFSLPLLLLKISTQQHSFPFASKIFILQDLNPCLTFSCHGKTTMLIITTATTTSSTTYNSLMSSV